MSALPPLTTAYRSLLHRNRLTPDILQSALVDRLSTLQTELSSPPPPKSHPPPPRGLYIHGGVGTGKSRIADLFASTLPPHVSKRRIHFHEFMLDVHARLHVARSQSHYAGDPLVQIGRDVASESRVLCFDEFQVSDIADAMILRRLFGAVWSCGGVLVSTSNRAPGRLYENGLNRELFVPFIGDLVRRCEVWEVEGREDYRMKGARGGERIGTFFLDGGTFEGSLEAKVQRLGGLERCEIAVAGGRELSVMAVRDEEVGSLLVRATFAELCQANRGSSDFIALCRSAKEIYVTGLRRFGRDELDIVRRFITLVDLAYEAGARIFCLSEVPLMEVFAEIVPGQTIPVEAPVKRQMDNMTVRGEGGSSSSMSSTFFGDMEWSATGLREASLATGGAGETDVRFAVGRAVSRLFEMGSPAYRSLD